MLITKKEDLCPIQLVMSIQVKSLLCRKILIRFYENNLVQVQAISVTYR